MTTFDEAKTPLRLDNIQAWARDKFPDAFDALPQLDEVIFVNVNDFLFDRPIRRSLGRSSHKKLLVVGAHSPGIEVEDIIVCAHIHADESAVTYFWIDPQENGDLVLHNVNSTGHIAFHDPFSDVGDDTGNAKAITRVEAIISYYFLAAGHLTELVRYKNFATLFTKGFEEGCRWIENDGERPTSVASARSVSVNDVAVAIPAINPSVLRSATRRAQASPLKRERENMDAQEKPIPKRPALSPISSNIRRPSPKRSLIAKLVIRPEARLETENDRLRAQIASLIADKTDLQQQLAMKEQACRGLRLEMDERNDEMADMQAMNLKLRASMKTIREVAGEQVE